MQRHSIARLADLTGTLDTTPRGRRRGSAPSRARRRQRRARAGARRPARGVGRRLQDRQAGCSRSKARRSCGRSTERGDRVFLDLKFHDIPNTVATAVAAATQLGVWMVNVHASGGTHDDAGGARRGARHGGSARTGTPPLVIARHRAHEPERRGAGETGRDRLQCSTRCCARAAGAGAGLDGVVASPLETAAIREALRPTSRS